MLGIPAVATAQTQIINFVNPRILTRDLWNVSYEYRPAGSQSSYGVMNALYFHALGLDYTGVKFGPFYRYYFQDVKTESETAAKPENGKPKNRDSMYTQFKAVGGFFDSDVRYTRWEDVQYEEDLSRIDDRQAYIAFGGGWGFGYQYIIKEKIDLDFYMGFQWIRQDVSRTLQKGTYIYDYNKIKGVYTNPWYTWGPGSFFEIRMSMGLVL
jgi:hypothetical protein